MQNGMLNGANYVVGDEKNIEPIMLNIFLK